MDVLEVGRRVLGALGEVGELARPVAELVGDGGRWEREVTGALDRRAVTSLGPLRLGGRLVARVRLSRGTEAPAGGVDAAGDARAGCVASLVLSGSVDARLPRRTTPGAGSPSAGGSGAGVTLTFAHHRRCRRDRSARAALADLLRHLASPWDVPRVGALAPGEELVLEAAGDLRLAAEAGCALARVRQAAPLDRASALFRLAEPLALAVGAEARARVEATLSGRARLVVTRGRRPGHARVRLLRRRDDLVGLGLNLAAHAGVANADAFATAAVDAVFTVPDGLVAEVAGVLADLDTAAQAVDALGHRVRAAVTQALAGEGAAVTTVEVARALDGLRSLGADDPGAARALRALEHALARLDAARERLVRFVDDGLASLTLPLDEVRRRLADWLDRYDTLRAEVSGHLERVAAARVTAELAVGVNRTAAHEALLDLEVRLDDRGGDYLALLAGDWRPVLAAARDGADGGVALARCGLVGLVRRDRHLELRLDLVGHSLARDLKRWTELRVERYRPDAALAVVSGQAGASLSQCRGAVEEAQVVFDLAAASGPDGRPAGLGLAVAVHRSIVEPRVAVVPALVAAHLAGARALGRIGAAHSGVLEAALLAEEGAYAMTFDLAIPPDAARRALLLDVEADEGELRRRAWAAFLAAAALADQPVGGGRRTLLLSACATPAMIELVTTRPAEVFDVVLGRRAPFTPLPRATEVATWLLLLQAHHFIGALLRARAAVVAGDDAPSLAADLARLAARTRDQVGAVAGSSVEAKYLMLARLAGVERCDVTLTFARGGVKVTV